MHQNETGLNQSKMSNNNVDDDDDGDDNDNNDGNDCE